MCNSGSVVIFSSEYSVVNSQAVKFVTHQRIDSFLCMYCMHV